MDTLRMGRYSLLFAIIGISALIATFFVPTIFVLSGLFGVTILCLGLLGARTRAGRIGLSTALLVLPAITFLAYRFGFEARLREKRPAIHSVDVYFSPNGGCTNAIVSQINGAKKSVLVQAYSFTSKPIAQAVVAAHRRGVVVKVILDKSQKTEKYSSATFLYNNGIIPLIDSDHAIAHNKVIVIDSSVVITGSMNFSQRGEYKNAENVLVLHDESLAVKYLENWNNHAQHSAEYERSSSIQPISAEPSDADGTDVEE